MTKLAIVTGAGQGIGEGIAHRLAKDGFAIAVADINGETADKVTSDLNQAGYKAKSYHLDVADRQSVFDLVDKAVSDLGELAVYVNNAGVAFIDEIVNSAEKISVDFWMSTCWEPIGEPKPLPNNLRNRATVAELSMLHPLQELKLPLSKVPIQFQSSVFGELPKPLQKN